VVKIATSGATRWGKLLPLAVVFAGVVAYSNSFGGAFVFDDVFRMRRSGISAARCSTLRGR